MGLVAVPGLWGRAPADVFMQDTRILSIVSCQATGGMGSNSEGLCGCFFPFEGRVYHDSIGLEVLAKLR